MLLTNTLLPGLHAAAAPSFDDRLNQLMRPISDAISSVIFVSVPVNGVALPLIVVWLIAGALIFTLWMGFINIRGFRQAIRVVRGRYDDPNAPGEVTHFQALTSALSGTVGLGNIAGVAVAISLGGPGATFWMILAGLLGMTSKFVECTLGVHYREVTRDGRLIGGGPMYTMTKGLAERGMPRLGKIMAVFFSIFCLFAAIGAANLFQVNQATAQLVSLVGGETSFLGQNKWLCGLVFAIIAGLVIVGGIRSIGRVTSKLVPLMGALYLGGAVVVLAMNVSHIPDALGTILSGAFDPEGVAGGIIGVMIQGIRRATFSNEAGIGSAAIAHAAAKTREPVAEGLVALLEPFIDTVVICTMTALVIVITGAYLNTDLEGVNMTSAAFGQHIAWFPNLLGVAVILFAYSTMLTWFYYAETAWRFLFGPARAGILGFRLFYLSCALVGSSASLGAIVDFADASLFAMALPNMIIMYMFAPKVKRMLKDYMAKAKSGELDRDVAAARAGAQA